MSEIAKDKLSLFELYFSMKGRISRLQLAAFYFLPMFFITNLAAYSVILAIFRDYFSIIMLGKRARDINLPLWFPVLVFAALVVINKFADLYPIGEWLFGVIFLLIPTKKENNQYGNSCEIYVFNRGTDRFLKKAFSASISFAIIACSIAFLFGLDYIFAPSIPEYFVVASGSTALFFLVVHLVEKDKLKLSIPFVAKAEGKAFYTHPTYVYKIIVPFTLIMAAFFPLLWSLLIKAPMPLIKLADFLSWFWVYINIYIMAMVCIFSIKLSATHISGYNNWGVKSRCHWDDIKFAKLKKYCYLYPYYCLYNEEGKCIIVIPYKGLIKNKDFKAAVLENAGTDHPLSKLIKERE